MFFLCYCCSAVGNSSIIRVILERFVLILVDIYLTTLQRISLPVLKIFVRDCLPATVWEECINTKRSTVFYARSVVMKGEEGSLFCKLNLY
jgi:hypothetical protein